jgi:hypothetical protein
MWLKHLIFHLCPKLNFPSINQFSQDILLGLVKKTNQLYVVPTLAKCHYATTSFDLWMFKGACDVFALVIYFLSSGWQSKHVIINLFEAIKTIGQVLAKSLIELLDKYGLRKKIIVYVKDEGSNLNAMTRALKFVVNCEYFGLEESF